MPESAGVVVIGAGPAGLATSHELLQAGVEHVVLDRGRVGETWRARWDSFCLVTPNWTVQLPGGAYDGNDPDGFMPRDEIVSHLSRYAGAFGAPVRERTEVTSLEPISEGGFKLRTTAGELRADEVVVATGAYQRPHRPEGATSLPAELLTLDVEAYRTRREESLIALAERVAKQVSRSGRPIVLEPMPPNERRVVHMTLREHPEVATESNGEGQDRRITVMPRGASEYPPEP